MEIKQGKFFTLLPPAPNLCPECATKHDQDQPHNAQSFYYQFKFNQEHGRSPTWNDAMAHCSKKVKNYWKSHLEKLGIDLNSTNLTGNIKNKEELLEKINE